MTDDIWLDVFMHAVMAVTGILSSRLTARVSPEKTGVAAFWLGLGIAGGGLLTHDIGQLAGWGLDWLALPLVLAGGVVAAIGAHTDHLRELRKQWKAAGKPERLSFGSRWDRGWMPVLVLLAIAVAIPVLHSYTETHEISSPALVAMVLLLCVSILASVAWFLRWVGIKRDSVIIRRWANTATSHQGTQR